MNRLTLLWVVLRIDPPAGPGTALTGRVGTSRAKARDREDLRALASGVRPPTRQPKTCGRLVDDVLSGLGPERRHAPSSLSARGRNSACVHDLAPCAPLGRSTRQVSGKRAPVQPSRCMPLLLWEFLCAATGPEGMAPGTAAPVGQNHSAANSPSTTSVKLAASASNVGTFSCEFQRTPSARGTLTLFTVCKRHLAGAEPVRAAADEGGGRRSVMRRAESLTIERGRSAGQLDHHVLEPVVRSAVRPGHADEIADPRTRVVFGLRDPSSPPRARTDRVQDHVPLIDAELEGGSLLGVTDRPLCRLRRRSTCEPRLSPHRGRGPCRGGRVSARFANPRLSDRAL